jgi:hypothetical protein
MMAYKDCHNKVRLGKAQQGIAWVELFFTWLHKKHRLIAPNGYFFKAY